MRRIFRDLKKVYHNFALFTVIFILIILASQTNDYPAHSHRAKRNHGIYCIYIIVQTASASTHASL